MLLRFSISCGSIPKRVFGQIAGGELAMAGNPRVRMRGADDQS